MLDDFQNAGSVVCETGTIATDFPGVFPTGMYVMHHCIN